LPTITSPEDRPTDAPPRGVQSGRARPLVLAALLAGLAAACGGRAATRAAGLTDSTYVEVMARLALVDSTLAPADYQLPDSLPPDSARSLVLERWGVADSSLVAFAEEVGSEPERMQGIWQRIRELADSLATRGWRPDRPEAS